MLDRGLRQECCDDWGGEGGGGSKRWGEMLGVEEEIWSRGWEWREGCGGERMCLGGGREKGGPWTE